MNFQYEVEFQYWLVKELKKLISAPIYTEQTFYDKTAIAVHRGSYCSYRIGTKKVRVDIWIPSLSVVIECKRYEIQRKHAISQLSYYKKFLDFKYGLAATAEKAENDKVIIIDFLQNLKVSAR